MIILGNTGMLGSMVARVMPDLPTLSRPKFDATSDHVEEPVINCIGLIKPHCGNVKRAILVNAVFPHTLAPGSIQIATDCVYSGSKGSYVETDPHDATDVYGKTKSLGEAGHIHNLRCSIIGPELKNHLSLLDWFLEQREALGFTNHLWNGITTYHFAKIVGGALKEGIALPQLQHIVPADVVTKAELLRIIAKAYDRPTKITDAVASEAVDRTLSTLNPELNLRLWQAAGYDTPPTIEEMVIELANL